MPKINKLILHEKQIIQGKTQKLYRNRLKLILIQGGPSMVGIADPKTVSSSQIQDSLPLYPTLLSAFYFIIIMDGRHISILVS